MSLSRSGHLVCFLLLSILALLPLAAWGQHTYLQSAFSTSDPPAWFYPSASDKALRAEAISLYFSGAEVLNENLLSPTAFTDIRNTSAGMRSVAINSGQQRELLGYWNFARMPGFFWPNELAAQPASWRAQALKSNGQLWVRYPENIADANGNVGGLIAVTGDNLDITNRDAVAQFLRTLAVTFNTSGAASQSVGPLYGYFSLNEWKLTETYRSVYSSDVREHDVDSPDRRIRAGAKPTALGTKHFDLMVDDDPYVNFLQAPRRAIPLYSQTAAQSFAAYAAGRGFSYTMLPADRDDFNQDDASLVPLPTWVQFVDTSDTTYWSVWNDWVYETWSSFLEDVLRTIVTAQAGNTDFRGVTYFQLPAWYSLPESSSQSITYPYYDASGALQSATEILRNYPEYSKLNPVTFGTNMDYMLRSPWVAGMLHETTSALHTPTCGGTLPAHEQCVYGHDRFRHYFMAQGALAKRVAQQNGKLFQSFARAQYFSTGDDLTPVDFDTSFTRTVALHAPSTVSTIGPWFIDVARLPAIYQSVVRCGSSADCGQLQDIFQTKMTQLRAAFPFQFTELPLPQQVTLAGQSAGFHARVGGTATATYRWQYSATSATSGFNDMVDGGGVSGSGTPHLTLGALTAARGGWYRARASTASPVQSITSSAGRLIVEPTTVIGETGTVSVSNTPQTVLFSRSYSNPVVIAQPPTQNGGDTAVVRITSVLADRFTLYMHEAPNRDGVHAVEQVNWMVVEAGRWALSNGLEVSAGKQSVSANVGPGIASSWATLNYPASFTATPAVLSQVQTNNGASWVKTRQRNTTISGFDVALEQHDLASTAHAAETVGWIAFTPGSGLWSGRPYIAAVTNGVTDAWTSIQFAPANLGAVPVAMAAISSYNNSDGAALRLRNLHGRSMQLRVEEDSTQDAETVHPAESIAYVALGAGGVLRGTALNSCVLPTLTQHPQSTTVSPGANVLFSAAASGSAPLSYQWQRNASNIPGATASTYSITNVQTSHAGLYRVRVSNGCATVYSSEATLTVQVGQSPYLGTPYALPGLLQTERYDTGGEGIAYHDTTIGNLGGAYRSDDVDLYSVGAQFGLGWTEPGEWTEYTGSIAAGSTFDVDIRYATPAGGRSLGLQLDGSSAFASTNLPDTGGWGEFQTAVVPGVPLSAGSGRVLRLAQNTGGINIDWLRVRAAHPAHTLAIRDTFSGVAAGAALNGRVSEFGSRTWAANASTLAGTLGNFTGTTASNPLGTVSFNPASYGNRPIVIDAQIAPTASEWMAVGLTNHPLNGWWGVGQLWVLLKPAGRFSVLANGTAIVVSGSELDVPAAAGFDGNSYNHVRLVYTPATRQAELWINGVQAMAPTVVPSGFVPSVSYAGWAGLNVTQNSSRIDGFEVYTRN